MHSHYCPHALTCRNTVFAQTKLLYRVILNANLTIDCDESRIRKSILKKKKFRFCQVTLQLQPLFKRSISYVVKSDVDLGDQVASFGRQHEFADISWYPSQGKAVYRVDDRVSSNTSGNGLYDSIPFRSTLSLGLAIIRATGSLLYIYIYQENMCCLYTNRYHSVLFLMSSSCIAI